MTSIQPYKTPEEKPNWGVIIATGVAGLLLVCGLGLLVSQASDYFIEATLTPLPRYMTSEPAQALRVSHEGYWTATITFIVGDTQSQQNFSGTGRYTTPDYQAPPGANVIIDFSFRIVVTYPLLGAEPRIINREMPILGKDEYNEKVMLDYYTIYDEQGELLMVGNENELKSELEGLPVQDWRPE